MLRRMHTRVNILMQTYQLDECKETLEWGVCQEASSAFLGRVNVGKDIMEGKDIIESHFMA